MADRFKQVAVLMGGPSDEREVSLRSGTAVARGQFAVGDGRAAGDIQQRVPDACDKRRGRGQFHRGCEPGPAGKQAAQETFRLPQGPPVSGGGGGATTGREPENAARLPGEMRQGTGANLAAVRGDADDTPRGGQIQERLRRWQPTGGHRKINLKTMPPRMMTMTVTKMARLRRTLRSWRSAGLPRKPVLEK